MLKQIRHRGLWACLIALGCVWPVGRAQAADTLDATITVTPAPLVSMDLPTTTYAFGPIDVNLSTNSATSLALTNIGEVSVTVDKQITDSGGWTAGTSVGLDTFVLYVATSTSRLGLTDFGASTQFGGLFNVSPLTGPLGTAPTLPPSGAGSSVDLWFRLDMPDSLTSAAGKTITVRFTATAQ